MNAIIIRLLCVYLAVSLNSLHAQWSTTPTTLDTEPPFPNASSSAYIVADASGNVTAAWLENKGSTVVQAAYYNADAGAWTAPVTIDQDNGAAAQPRLVVDTTGIVTAVWIEYLGGSYLIQAARFNGTAWTAPVTLNNGAQTPNAYLSFQPLPVVDPMGNVTVLWIEQQSGRYAVQAARYSAGAWTASPTTLNGNTPNAYVNIAPQIVVDKLGNVTAVWIEQVSGLYAVQAARYSDGIWITPTTLDGNMPNAHATFAPYLITDELGNATVTWIEHVGGAQAVQAARFSNNLWSSAVILNNGIQTPNAVSSAYAVADSAGNVTATWLESLSGTVVQAAYYTVNSDSWSAPVVINQTNSAATQPLPVVDKSGIVTAVWIEFLNSSFAVQASRFNGTVWTAPVILNNGTQSPNALSSFLPQPVVDAENNVTVAWFEQQQSGYAVQAARFSADAWTTTPTTLNGNTPDAYLYTPLKIISSTNGTAYVAWIEQKENALAIEASRFADNMWTPTAILNNGTQNPDAFTYTSLQLIADLYGNATVTWLEKSDFPVAAQVNRFSVPPAILPPRNLKGYQSVNQFLTQSEYSNNLSWRTPLLGQAPVAYRVYRNISLTDLAGTVQAGNEQPKFVDHNRIPGQPYSYYIVSVDARGNVSKPASITVR